MIVALSISCWKHKYDDQPTYAQATNLSQPYCPYSINAMNTVASNGVQRTGAVSEVVAPGGNA